MTMTRSTIKSGLFPVMGFELALGTNQGSDMRREK